MERGPQGRQDPAEQARDICLRRLALRPHTRKELEDVLLRRGVDPEVVAEVLARYHDVGMIDDRAFAEAWVTSRHAGRGLARGALARELRRKGVAEDTLGDALAVLNPDSERETARALVARKLRQRPSDAPEKTMRRLVGMLARKGYPAGMAFQVVREVMAEKSENADFDAENGFDELLDMATDADNHADEAGNGIECG